MRAKDVMTTAVITVQPDTTVQEIARLMLECRVSAVPVVENRNLVGIVSEGDLMRRPEAGTQRKPSWWLRMLMEPAERAAEYVKTHGRFARDVMTSDVVSVEEDTPVAEIAALLEKHRIKRVPVVRDGRVVGIVSRANLLHALATAGTDKTPIQSDEELRNVILDTLNKETDVRTEFINVLVTDGIVHLWGAARSEAEKRAVRVVAENLVGPSRVEDRLGVLPPVTQGALT